ncbi:VOC family protein [Pseudalkalibacillus hwajinpoensis]|uniref:VOC family protein n=1 Tax=Guptibacillus hwajinpoensis TaxID=208199 RepID=UPI00325AC2A6
MSINYKRLHHLQICIPSGEEERARDFYLSKLGFQEIEKPKQLKKNGGFWAEIANIEIHIGVEKQVIPGKRHPAFEVNDIENAREHLKKHNVTIQPQIEIDGYKRFSFYDPFKNRIEFIEPTK